MNSKIKVVWICHFSNQTIQKRLKPWRVVRDYAPWIPNTVRLFHGNTQIELHLVSPHEYIPATKHFVDNGIHYHFFNPGIPLWGRHWPNILKWDLITDYWYSKRSVKNIVQKINPDIIHLQGAENPYYSVSIIQFAKKYPVVINLQRMTLDFSFGKSKGAKRREAIERAILSDFKHFSIRTDTMREDIITYNPKAVTHFVQYNIPDLIPSNSVKKYDIVFFGRVTFQKGIEDVLGAIKIVSESKPDISLCIIGRVEKKYKEYLLEQTKDIMANITWMGLLPSFTEVHNEVSKARISVLPTHYDIIPGTIIESMQLGLPVVSYRVGSIAELNSEVECVLLSELGDVRGLARNILNLLTDDNLHETMKLRGIERIRLLINQKCIVDQHIDCYKKVIQDF